MADRILLPRPTSSPGDQNVAQPEKESGLHILARVAHYFWKVEQCIEAAFNGSDSSDDYEEVPIASTSKAPPPWTRRVKIEKQSEPAPATRCEAAAMVLAKTICCKTKKGQQKKTRVLKKKSSSSNPIEKLPKTAVKPKAEDKKVKPRLWATALQREDSLSEDKQSKTAVKPKAKTKKAYPRLWATALPREDSLSEDEFLDGNNNRSQIASLKTYGFTQKKKNKKKREERKPLLVKVKGQPGGPNKWNFSSDDELQTDEEGFRGFEEDPETIKTYLPYRQY